MINTSMEYKIYVKELLELFDNDRLVFEYKQPSNYYLEAGLIYNDHFGAIFNVSSRESFLQLMNNSDGIFKIESLSFINLSSLYCDKDFLLINKEDIFINLQDHKEYDSPLAIFYQCNGDENDIKNYEKSLQPLVDNNDLVLAYSDELYHLIYYVNINKPHVLNKLKLINMEPDVYIVPDIDIHQHTLEENIKRVRSVTNYHPIFSDLYYFIC